jgi:hypothetical protein
VSSSRHQNQYRQYRESFHFSPLLQSAIIGPIDPLALYSPIAGDPVPEYVPVQSTVLVVTSVTVTVVPEFEIVIVFPLPLGNVQLATDVVMALFTKTSIAERFTAFVK